MRPKNGVRKPAQKSVALTVASPVPVLAGWRVRTWWPPGAAIVIFIRTGAASSHLSPSLSSLTVTVVAGCRVCDLAWRSCYVISYHVVWPGLVHRSCFCGVKFAGAAWRRCRLAWIKGVVYFSWSFQKTRHAISCTLTPCHAVLCQKTVRGRHDPQRKC